MAGRQSEACDPSSDRLREACSPIIDSSQLPLLVERFEIDRLRYVRYRIESNIFYIPIL